MSRLVRSAAGVLAAVAGSVPTTAWAEPRPAESCSTTLRIASIGVKDEVRSYSGSPDDAKGTRIQNRGLLASPVGTRGGVLPGQIGNFHVDGHRNTAGGPLLDLVDVERGDAVKVRIRCPRTVDVTFTYSVTSAPRYVNFFTAAGRQAQIAERPFRAGEAADNAYLTVSTCATQEDAARGEHRRDRFGNPPGRWVVVGVLSGTVRRPAA